MSDLTYTIIGNTDEMSHEEWLDVRKTGIGGSDVAGLVGISRYATPLSVYMDKMGITPPVADNDPMYWGRTLEGVVADEFVKRTGIPVKHYPHVLRSKNHPFMLANVDRLLVHEQAGLECKTANAAAAKDWEDNKVPEAYMLQCYHYMIVTGMRKWYVAVLIGGNNFQIRELSWDDELASQLVAREQEFWKMVEDKTPPAVGGGDVDLMSCLYSAGDNPDLLMLGDAEMALALEYNSASAVEKQAKAAKDEAKAKLCAVMGDHAKAVAGDMKINWSPVSTTRLDTDRLKKEKPEIVKEYSRTDTSRRFSIK